MRQKNHLFHLPELALRVEERQAGSFFWVLLTAGTPKHMVDISEALYYRPHSAAIEPQGVYWEALLLGMAELRRVLATDAPRPPDKAPAVPEVQGRT